MGSIKFEHLPMPNCILAGVIILCVVGLMGLIFTCQNDYRYVYLVIATSSKLKRKSHDMGNKVFRRMTRMTISGPKAPKEEKREDSKPSQKEYEKAKDVLNQNPKLMERSDSGSSQGAFISTEKQKVHYEDDPKNIIGK